MWVGGDGFASLWCQTLSTLALTLALEGKLGYAWMNADVGTWGPFQTAAFVHAAVQIPVQYTVAKLCGLDYNVYLSNKEALSGFTEKIMISPDPYRNVGIR